MQRALHRTIIDILPRLRRTELCICVEAMIDLLDALDGDPDLENESDSGADDFGEAEEAA